MCDCPSDGENLEVAVAKYRYARVFLAYLDAAETLRELRESLPVVQTARDLIRNGRDMLFESTPSPDALEVNYRLCYGKLVDTVPFAI